MNSGNEREQQEVLYLEKTLKIINKELAKVEKELPKKISDVIASRKEMWNESVHFSEDFDRIPEMNHYLTEVNRETRDYASDKKAIETYKRMIKAPYFGRFDFKEEYYDDIEKIYIGLHNLMDEDTDDIYVYDWRAPISSMYYRNELGKGSYKSPIGMVSGEILLKRQYKIQDSKLKYFFDSSIVINDEILQEVLSGNSSSAMRSIVETIQKEQDMIIRDNENELLIVQGAAGSGKTSIALHRIAYLFYEGMNSKLNANNVIIISPNSIFSKYISSVLPELGEENVDQITFDGIAARLLKEGSSFEGRYEQLESLVALQGKEGFSARINSAQLKGSEKFVKLLNRLLEYCERVYIDFKDIYYDGEIIETRQQLRNFFLNNKIDIPISKRLKRIENMILNKVHPLRNKRLVKLEKLVDKNDNHRLEIKPFSRLLAIKEAKVFMDYLHSFTQIDYFHLYKLLFNNKRLFLKLSKDIELPENIEDIVKNTKEALNKNRISFEDCAPLIYLKMKLEGNESFKNIKQVVIDEAQDYYPIQYEVFKLLFKGARYTVLGDFNQTLEKSGDKHIYDFIGQILQKKRWSKISINKSYRSSFEITSFTKRLLKENSDIICFERHEEEPKVIFKESEELINEALIENINKFYSEGYESIAILCKTTKEAVKVQEKLKGHIPLKVLNNDDIEFNSGPLAVPAYLAKGLEFDVVIVYDASAKNYNSEFDRNLLYIACTRALHKLLLYYTDKKSQFI